ncbi:MAG: hypothetical protein WC780_00435 [Lentimicrobiaceae bacterium]|jgi:hypothetical protein
MTLEQTPKAWTDIIDQEKYDLTGVAILYRNPQIKPSFDSTKYDPTNHIYSLDLGENCIFNQKPIAYGLTAYIGHEEIKSGYNSLRSNRRNGKLGYQTLDYYHNYSSRLFEKYSLDDKKKPRPKSDKRLQIDFYTELIIAEEKNLDESERFYSESQNEADHLEKENLREFVAAFFDWLDNKLSDLNPDENNFRGLGGLREITAQYIWKSFKGKFIHSRTKPEYFIGIFQNLNLPDGWERVEWIGDKASLFSFMDQVFSKKVEPRFINKYFKVKGEKLHGHHRTVTENPDIKNILDCAKTIRPLK